MQAEAPEAVDLSRETEETRRLYGIDREETATFGRNCLLARRLVERGVRFVQLYHGAGSKWDAHSDIEKNHEENCRSMDLPVAGLLKDLKRRGLLDQTLVVWGGEFGRTPMSEKGDGRDHNPYGFTMWLAGGGVQGGRVIGQTDEFGLHAVEDRLHVHDLHATILHLMGLDHQPARLPPQGPARAGDPQRGRGLRRGSSTPDAGPRGSVGSVDPGTAETGNSSAACGPSSRRRRTVQGQPRDVGCPARSRSPGEAGRRRTFGDRSSSLPNGSTSGAFGGWPLLASRRFCSNSSEPGRGAVMPSGFRSRWMASRVGGLDLAGDQHAVAVAERREQPLDRQRPDAEPAGLLDRPRSGVLANASSASVMFSTVVLVAGRADRLAARR